MEEFLKSNIKNNIRNSDAEIEVRFGSRGKTFKSSVNLSDYQRITNSIKDSYKITKEDITTDSYNDNIRHRIIKVDGKEKEEWVEKNRSDQSYKFDTKDYDFRLSIATEKPIEEPESPGEILSTRRMERTKYYFKKDKKYLWVVDMSKVESEDKITMEVEIELISKDVDGFVEFVQSMYKIYKNTHNVYKIDDSRKVNKRFAFLSGAETNKFYIDSKLVTKMRNLKFKDLVMGGIIGGKTPYRVTDKSDGERKFMSIIDDKLWLYDTNNNYNFISNDITHKAGEFILEGEMIPVKNRTDKEDDGKIWFYVYDCLFYGENLRHNSHTERMEKAEKVVNFIKKNLPELINIKLKTFQALPQSTEDFYKAMKDQFERSLPYDNDGLVFIPDSIYNPLENKDNKWKNPRDLSKHDDLVKWKPMSHLSIDLKVIYNEEGFDLYGVNYTKQKNGTILGKDIPFFEMVNYTGEAKIADRTNKMIGSLYKSKESNIVEFIRTTGEDSDKFLFTAFRSRPEKTTPNSEAVIKDIWYDIQDPITESDLTGNGIRFMRKYHGRIKNSLYNDMKAGSSILEIGSGKGGDIGKWDKFSSVVAIEPNDDNIKEFRKRLEDSKNKDKVEVHQALGQDVDKITEIMNGDKVDYIVFMLSLTFFWEDEETFDNLVQMIKNNLKPNGEVIFSVMDGELTEKALFDKSGEYDIQNPGKLSIGVVSMKLENPSFDRDSEDHFGRKINLVFPSDTIVGEQTEYLTYINDLSTALGMSLSKKIMDGSEELLNENEKKLTKLYSYGVLSFNIGVPPKFNSKIEVKNIKERLSNEWDQFLLTQDLLQHLTSGFTNQRTKHELTNSLERWFFGALEYDFDPKWERWTIYKEMIRSDKEKPMYKFIEEIGKHVKDSEQIAEELVNIILERMKDPPHIYDGLEIEITDSSIKIRSGNKTCEVQSPNIKHLAKKGNKEDLACVALRYQAIISGSQHWGLTKIMYSELYDVGFKHEGFASPFNSRLVELGHDDVTFCSIFYDTDQVFGSIGDFFKIDLVNISKKSGNYWTINPPYIETFLNRTRDKILESSPKGLVAVYLLPGWDDSVPIQDIIKASSIHNKLLKGKHDLQMVNGKIFIASHDDYIGIIKIDKDDVYDKVRRIISGDKKEMSACSIPVEKKKKDQNVSMLSYKKGLTTGEVTGLKDLVRLETIGDGNCLFHSVLGSFSKIYRKASIKDKKHMGVTIRDSLSYYLASDYEHVGESGYQYNNWAMFGEGRYSIGMFNYISNIQSEYNKRLMDPINTKDTDEELQENSINFLKEFFKSNVFTGDETFALLSDVIGYDIYVFDIMKYKTNLIISTKSSNIKRPAIMVGHVSNHYETMGKIIFNDDGKVESVQTVFNSDDEVFSKFPESNILITSPDEIETYIINIMKETIEKSGEYKFNKKEEVYQSFEVYRYVIDKLGEDMKSLVISAFNNLNINLESIDYKPILMEDSKIVSKFLKANPKVMEAGYKTRDDVIKNIQNPKNKRVNSPARRTFNRVIDDSDED
jgi:hypothetical protein